MRTIVTKLHIIMFVSSIDGIIIVSDAHYPISRFMSLSNSLSLSQFMTLVLSEFEFGVLQVPGDSYKINFNSTVARP